MNEFIYGRQPVREVMRASRRHVAGLYVADSLRDKSELGDLLQLARSQKLSVMRVKKQRIDGLVGQGVNHQGIAIEVGPYPYVTFERLLTEGADPGSRRLFLLLDGVQDPQNLGSLLRSADAAGIAGVVLPERRAVHVTPAVVRASAGAAEHVRTARVANLVSAVKTLREHDILVAGLDGGPDAQDYLQARLAGDAALVVGSEGCGMRRLVRETCDVLLRIPMQGRVNSLNAAIAGAIALFQVRALQHSGRPSPA